ncbi:hypothetical protein AURDEDRAFT_173111 [Auricularia subglabra TFB-10046 SS5]|nr:hypothetical protein AURDEDRAFT_173111 [Auricularia subglabra TFB-10046 SS5]
MATLVCYYVGEQLGLVLFGASLVQYWGFLKHSSKDPVWLRVVVPIISMLGLTFAALVSVGVYDAVRGAPVLGPDPTSDTLISSAPIRAAIIVVAPYTIMVVQWFYAFRLFRLTESRVLLGVILTLSSVTLPLVIYAAVMEFNFDASAVSGGPAVVSSASLFLIIVCDAVITVSMIRFLRQNRTHIKRTDSMMTSLSNYTLASGLTTLVGSCLVVVTYLAAPRSPIYQAIIFVLPHLYTNSLLALLNARRSLRERSLLPTTSIAAEDRSHAFPQFLVPGCEGVDSLSSRADILPLSVAICGANAQVGAKLAADIGHAVGNTYARAGPLSSPFHFSLDDVKWQETLVLLGPLNANGDELVNALTYTPYHASGHVP